MGKRRKLGLALCGAFGAYDRVAEAAKVLIAEGYELTPLFSETALSTDTRYGKAADVVNRFEALCGKKAKRGIMEAEAIGADEEYDLLLIAPCTGNTLARLAHGFADTTVTVAAKSQLRAGRPVLIALETDDAFGAAAKNIALQLCREPVYFMPMTREEIGGIPHLRADLDGVIDAVEGALGRKRIRSLPI